MNISDLKLFIKTVEVGNITKAAELMFISQPALSKALKRLEGEVGYPLFDRVGSQNRVNGNGMIFYDYARKIVELSELSKNEVARSNLGRQNKIVGLAEDTIVLRYLFPGLRRNFHGYGIEIRGAEEYRLKDLLLTDRCDFIVTHEDISDAGIECHMALHDRLGVVVYNEFLPEPPEKLQVSELKDFHFTCCTAGGGYMYNWINLLLEEENVRVDYRYVVDEISAWQIRDHECLEILRLSYMRYADKSAQTWIPIDHPDAERDIYVSFKRNRTGDFKEKMLSCIDEINVDELSVELPFLG